MSAHEVMHAIRKGQAMFPRPLTPAQRRARLLLDLEDARRGDGEATPPRLPDDGERTAVLFLAAADAFPLAVEVWASGETDYTIAAARAREVIVEQRFADAWATATAVLADLTPDGDAEALVFDALVDVPGPTRTPAVIVPPTGARVVRRG